MKLEHDEKNLPNKSENSIIELEEPSEKLHEVVELVEEKSDEELDEGLEDVDDECDTVPKEVCSVCVDENPV